MVVKRAREIKVQQVLGLTSFRRQHIRCPFHNERTPSCVIYPDGGFHCFGCSKNGQNALDFLIAMGMTFKEALKYLDDNGFI